MAIGIANRTINQKKSKAMDLRFYWIRDRVDQKQYIVKWQPGPSNLADYFTKAHPVHHVKRMRQYYVHTRPLAKNVKN